MTRVSLILLLALMGSGLYLVKVSYEARKLFADIERAKADEHQLAAEATRLDAERRSEGTHLRVERDAREKLQMRLPTPDATLYVAETRAASGGAR
ncbi:cell division protein FtsL [Ideonella azotifigens]|uniref:Cell division protein FtsL n=2 Tax=Ideonella azotifigens TaxID=513160 RepID=A0ABN1KM31_9BURK|nr:cell division protein FtsL [Ideonella azotifigens]MCD2343405.1 cell division protein FtsL [Ideonella azotifigens]